MGEGGKAASDHCQENWPGEMGIAKMSLHLTSSASPEPGCRVSLLLPRCWGPFTSPLVIHTNVRRSGRFAVPGNLT